MQVWDIAVRRAELRAMKLRNLVAAIATSSLLPALWWTALNAPGPARVFLIGVSLITTPALLFSWGMMIWYTAKISELAAVAEQLDFVSNWHKELVRSGFPAPEMVE